MCNFDPVLIFKKNKNKKNKKFKSTNSSVFYKHSSPEQFQEIIKSPVLPSTMTEYNFCLQLYRSAFSSYFYHVSSGASL